MSFGTFLLTAGGSVPIIRCVASLIAQVWPFVVGSFFLCFAFFYWRKKKYKSGILFGIFAALFVLAPFPWWVFFTSVAIGTVWYLRFSINSERIDAVTEQTGERWYRVASKEIHSQRGREFLERHLAETLEPDRARTEIERLFAQTAALGIYLRLLDEKGRDAIAYHSLPVDEEALARARVLSRVAIRSQLWKDNI